VSTFADLAPQALAPSPGNRIHTPQAIEEMAASIRQVGILQSLLVVPHNSSTTGNDTAGPDPSPADGPQEAPQYRIVVGHRRHAAALLLGLESVPCLIAEAQDEAAQLIQMLTENLHRHDLSVQEEADGYAQLALLNLDPDQIAARLAFGSDRVNAGLALTRLPRQARTDVGRRIHDRQLNLDQVLALEEFADDEQALTQLLSAAGSEWEFRHQLTQQRAQKTKREQVEALTADLTLHQARVVPCPRDWGTGPYTLATDLLDHDGLPLDPQKARSRPGFRVWIDQNTNPVTPIVFCLNPDDWDYHRATPTQPDHDIDTADPAGQRQAEPTDDTYTTRAEQVRAEQVQAAQAADRERDARMRAEEAALAERRRAREERLQAFEQASTVRHDFLAAHYGTARAAKKALPEALRHALDRE